MPKPFGSDAQRRAAFARMSGKGTNAFNRDASVRAVNTLPDTPSNRKEWANNTRRIDLEGVDTPIRKGKSINKNKDNSRLPEKGGQKETKMDDYKYTPYKPKPGIETYTKHAEFHHLLSELRKKDGHFDRVELLEDARDDEIQKEWKKLSRKEYNQMRLDERDALLNDFYGIINPQLIKTLQE